MTYTYGVDVSHWQGDIDWQALYSQGVRFAFVKASQANWQDESLKSHTHTYRQPGFTNTVMGGSDAGEIKLTSDVNTSAYGGTETRPRNLALNFIIKT